MKDPTEIELKTSKSIEVVYDTSDPQTQWRCHLYSTTKPFNLAMLIGGPMLLVIAGMAPWLAASLVLIPCLIQLLTVHVSVKKRTRSQRLCTTSISPDGIRDTTPDSDKTFSWRHVKNIEFCSGDIYFFVPFREIFVPRSAFQDAIEAEQYYHSARMLWKQNNQIREKKLQLAGPATDEKEPLFIERKPPIVGQKPLVEEQKGEQKALIAEKKTFTLADYDAQEEEQWKQYEAHFKKTEEVKRKAISQKLEELERLEEGDMNGESKPNGSE